MRPYLAHYRRDFEMHGPAILVRSLSAPVIKSKLTGRIWQYHRQSDRHSKIACWGIIFDLLIMSKHIRDHISSGKTGFGINHTMINFVGDKKKNLDLVLCTPGSQKLGGKPQSLKSLVDVYGIALTSQEAALLGQLPALSRVPVGNVLMALEAKAAMTEHQKALPRLFDELNSTYQTINGSSGAAIASAYLMVNASTSFVSPSRQHPLNPASVVTAHEQPRAAELAIGVAKALPRRAGSGIPGYDAIGITVIDMVNDGSPVKLVTAPPAPQLTDIYHYENMVDRLAHTYATRFKHL
jgi:hypothetical protein